MINSFDVIVVGAGVAGIYAAEQALRSGAKTALVCKGRVGEVGRRGSGASQCGATERGIPAFFRLLDDEFDAEDFTEMIINGGLGLVEREMVSFFVEEFVKMQSSADEIMSRYSQPGAATLGTPLIRPHLEFLQKNTEVYDRTSAVELLTREGTCCGVLCVDEVGGETFPLYGKTVILAAGSDAGLFSVNVHPDCVTGDGYALGLKAGAEAINLEFMQIFAMSTTPTRNLIHFTKEEHLASLTNGLGEEFLTSYLPDGITREECVRQNILHAPFSVRDEASRYLAIGIVEEIKAGRGTSSGGVYVDLRDCDSKRDPVQEHFLKSRGIDVSSAPIEITMGFQCCNGGLRVNRKMETTLPGLYAAGENAGGLHGADRLGGNMLTGCMISGKVAGEQAAQHASKIGTPEQIPFKPVRLLAHDPDQRKRYAPLLKRLRQSAWENLLVVRSKSSVKRFEEQMKEITEQSLPHFPTPIELENLLILGKALSRATLEREESRGGFYREDYPDPVPTVPSANVIAISESGEVSLRKEILDPLWDPESRDILGKERWG